MMLEAYFGFKKNPFPKEIKTEQMLETYDTKEASSRLSHIRQHRGIMCLTGEPGSGKTSVLRKFVDSLNPQIHLHCYSPLATISQTDLYRQINILLRLPPKMRKTDLFQQIQKSVMDLSHQGKTPVFILDEMHLMDHLTLQELILITNFEMDSKSPFIFVMIGQPELREKLKRQMHEPLRQRITLNYHMAGLTLEECRNYALHQLRIAGRSDPLLEDNSFEPIHQLSQGLPRKINNLCLAAMTVAMSKKSNTVTADHVVQAGAGL